MPPAVTSLIKTGIEKRVLGQTVAMEYLNALKELPGNFMKCGIAGWCLEIMFTSSKSFLARDWRLMGRTSLLMFPIYGCGAFLSPVLKLIDCWIGEQQVSLPERMIRHGMIDMVLIFTAEYLSGAWMKERGMCPWDYSASRASINGLIRLDFAPLWFATGLLFEQITKKRSK